MRVSRGLAFLLSLVLVGGAPAQTARTWDFGAGTDNWDTNNNWSSNNRPDSISETAVFGTTGSGNINFSVNRSVGGVIFNSGAASFTINRTGSLRILTLDQYGVTNNDDSLQTLTGSFFRLTLGNNTFFKVGSTGNLTISGTGGSITTTGYTLTLNGTGAGTGLVSSTIDGTGSLVKNESGTWILSGTNSYTGNTTLTAGTLGAGSNAAFGTTGNLILNGGTLIADGGARSLSTNVTINASSTIGGTNDITLGNATRTVTNTFAGDPTLTVSNTATTTIAGNLSLSNTATNRTLTIAGAGNVTISGNINNGSSSGSGLTYGGTGTLTLSNTTSTYSGATTVNSGNLSIASEAALGANPGSFAAGQLTLNGGTLLTTSTLTIDDSNRGLTLGSSGGTFDPSASTTLTIANAVAGTGALTKNGTGTLTLNSTTSSFSGGTVLNGGALNLNSAAALGTGGFTIAGSGTTLDNTSGSAVTISATGAQAWNNDFTFTGTNNLTLGTGTVTLGANRTITVAANQLAIPAIITDGASTFGITKAGAGTLLLSGANTYDGNTTVSAGTLALGSNTAAGTGTIVFNGGNVSASGGARTLANNVLHSVSGTVTGSNDLAFTGTFTNALNGTLTVNNSGLTTLGAVALSDNASSRTLQIAGTGNVVINGAISDGGVGAVSGLSKTGSGDLTFSGAGSNTYTGDTTVSAGTLILAKSGGATAVAGNLIVGDGTGTDTVRLDAANQIADTAAVTFYTPGGTPTLNLNGFSETVASISTTNTAAVLALGSPGSGTTFTFGNGSDQTFSGQITGGANAGLVKQGTGTVTFNSTTSSFTGNVAINAGTLVAGSSAALGAGTAGVTVADGAALNISGGAGITKGNLALTGTGTGAGALVNTSGVNAWYGNLTLGGNTTIGVSGGTLYLGTVSDGYIRDGFGTPPPDTHTLAMGAHHLTLTGSGTTLQINSRITGTGNLTINNAGGTVIQYANMNTYTGTTFINAGTLDVQTVPNYEPGNPTYPGFYGINGPVVIGDGAGAANSATLRVGSADEVLDWSGATPITLNRDGRFLLERVQTVNALTFNGGTVDIAASGLYLDATVTVNAGTGNVSNIITGGTGQLSLSRHFGAGGGTNANRLFNIGDATGDATSDLNISAQIVAGSVTKNGTGTMTFNGSITNTYEGTTTINNGILNIQKNTALGGAAGDDATATIVNSGGTLQLQRGTGNLTIASEKLILNGTGFSSRGALENIDGSNTWTGIVSLATDSRITSSGTDSDDLLTLSGTVSSATSATLSVYGAGNTTISGSIGGGGGLQKYEAGKLILSGLNTFAGATVVNGGILSAQHNDALGGAGSTTVSSGALELDSSANGNLNLSEASIVLNGSGLSSGGALRNVRGDNTVTGTIDIASAARINADYYTPGSVATNLTLSGSITGSASAALTFGGAGNTVVSGNIANTGGSLTWDGTGSFTASGNLGTVSNPLGALAKSGSGNFTFAGSGVTGHVGAASLTAGNMFVGSGPSTVLNTGAFSSVDGTTLTIASGAQVVADYASGTTFFSGDLAGNGIFEKKGAGTLVFDNSFTASDLTLKLSGGTLKIDSAEITVGTLHITGNTILDFSNSAGTFLSSSTLIIDAGVTVTVNGWVSVANDAAQSTVWYVTNTTNGIQGSSGNLTLGGTDIVGNSPLNQIVFTNYNGLTTTWVSGNHDGWFDREIRPTPEPATYGALFLGACLGLLGWRRWRREHPTAA